MQVVTMVITAINALQANRSSFEKTGRDMKHARKWEYVQSATIDKSDLDIFKFLS